MPRKRYTPAQRATALDLYTARGAAYASSETGIPQGTIQSWANRDGLTGTRTEAAAAQAEAQAAAWAVRRADFGERMANAASEFLDRALAASRASDARAYAITAAVCSDKADKLTGADVPEPVVDAEGARARVLDLLAEMETQMQGPSYRDDDAGA